MLKLKRIQEGGNNAREENERQSNLILSQCLEIPIPNYPSPAKHVKKNYEERGGVVSKLISF